MGQNTLCVPRTQSVAQFVRTRGHYGTFPAFVDPGVVVHVNQLLADLHDFPVQLGILVAPLRHPARLRTWSVF